MKLPGTKMAFRDGIPTETKMEIIARAVRELDPGEARAAETLVLDRGLAGRELPPALAEAADQKITARARHVHRAGLPAPGRPGRLRAKHPV